jgi:hypothetical protein
MPWNVRSGIKAVGVLPYVHTRVVELTMNRSATAYFPLLAVKHLFMISGTTAHMSIALHTTLSPRGQLAVHAANTLLHVSSYTAVAVLIMSSTPYADVFHGMCGAFNLPLMLTQVDLENSAGAPLLLQHLLLLISLARCCSCVATAAAAAAAAAATATAAAAAAAAAAQPCLLLLPSLLLLVSNAPGGYSGQPPLRLPAGINAHLDRSCHEHAAELLVLFAMLYGGLVLPVYLAVRIDRHRRRLFRLEVQLQRSMAAPGRSHEHEEEEKDGMLLDEEGLPLPEHCDNGLLCGAFYDVVMALLLAVVTWGTVVHCIQWIRMVVVPL